MTSPPVRTLPASCAHLPLLAGVLAAASFVSMDATIKTLAPRFDAMHLTFFRFVSGSVFAIALWLWFRSPLPRRAEWRLHALRCVLLLVSLVGYFHALRLLPLAQAVAISYLAPIFISLLAIVVLGERPSRWIWLALTLGLAGTLVSSWPSLTAGKSAAGSASLEGLLVGAASTVAFAGVMVLARRQAQRDAVWTILLVQNVLPAMVLSLAVGPTWQPPQATDFWPIMLSGVFATVGLLSLTWAFTHLEASRIAPLEYTSFVWAGGLGYLLFGEVPTVTTLASAALIVGGCLLLLRR
jgi:drug/metabolite transporter (DMT)-like permease